MKFSSKLADAVYKELVSECGRVSGEANDAIRGLPQGEKALATVSVLKMQFDMLSEAIRIASNIELQGTQMAAQATLLDMAISGK